MKKITKEFAMEQAVMSGLVAAIDYARGVSSCGVDGASAVSHGYEKYLEKIEEFSAYLIEESPWKPIETFQGMGEGEFVIKYVDLNGHIRKDVATYNDNGGYWSVPSDYGVGVVLQYMEMSPALDEVE